MTKWQTKQIQSLGRVVTGKTPPKDQPHYFDGDELFVSPKDLDWDHLYVTETETRVSSKALEKFRNQVIPKNTVMFTSLSFGFGKMGITSRASLTNQQINSIVVNAENHFRFVYYLLRASTPFIFAYNSGIDTPIVPKSVFERIGVKYPDLPLQRKIAAILSAYDDLIDNNKRRIALLEKMAEEIYREWFVRLRFPGHEKVKKVKGVPEGWRIEPMGSLLSEIIDYRGLTPAKLNSNWEDTGIIALSALNVKNGRLIRLEDTGKVSDTLYERWMRKKLQQFDILLTSEAPLGQVYMLMESEKYVLSQRLFGLRANPKLIAPCYLYHYLLFPIGQHQLTSRATGSTVGGIRQQLLRKVEVMLPTDKLLEAYTHIVLPILENIDRLSKQNSILIKSRDMLLPRLISGKLSVENLDIQFPPSMVEEVKAEATA